jgi:hypothetical protein
MWAEHTDAIPALSAAERACGLNTGGELGGYNIHQLPDT